MKLVKFEGGPLDGKTELLEDDTQRFAHMGFKIISLESMQWDVDVIIYSPEPGKECWQCRQ